MKKNLTKLGLAASILLTSTSALAEVSIHNIGIREGNLKFAETLFNRKVQITPGCKSVQEVFDQIDKTTGFNVINKTNLDVEAPICSGYKFNYLGDLLNAVIADMNVVFYEEGDQRIILEYAQEHSIKMPMNWDIEDTVNLLKNKFPNIKTYTFGQTIRMTGNREEMAKAKETLNRIKDWSQRTLPFNINVVKLNTPYTHDNPTLISKIDKKQYDKIHKIKVEHGTQFAVPNLGVLVFDMQKNRVILNGQKYISFDELNTYSFFKSGYQISFSTPFGTYVY